MKESGQSLVEIIVAVGLVMVTVTALLALGVIGIKSSGFGVAKAKAVKLANEEMELVRAYRDATDWDRFNKIGNLGIAGCSSDEGARCCISNADGLTLTTIGSESIPPFTRYFIASPNIEGKNSYTVTVYVSWADQSGEHVVKDSSIFTNWR